MEAGRDCHASHRRLRRDGPQAGEANLVSTGGPGAASAGEAERWLEVARLRNEHPDYVIVWLAPTRQFRAYPLKNARRADALTAVTAADLAEQISRAPPRR